MSGIINFDAPMYTPQESVKKDLRQLFYVLLKRISASMHLNDIHIYFVKGFSESRDIHFEPGYPSAYGFLLDLYKMQLIHPKNVDFLLKYASYSNNTEISREIVYYYGLVGGREDLLIDAKFDISPDKTPIQAFAPAFPPPSPVQIRPQFRSEIVQPHENNYFSQISSINPTEIKPFSEYAQPKPNPLPPVIKKKVDMLIYPIQAKNPRGICIIINNELFQPGNEYLKNRKGSTEDRKILVETFKQLRYDVHFYDNLTSIELLKLLSEVSQHNHSTYDSFVCCLLTHGREEVIYGVDSIGVHQREIFNIFQASSCPTLIGKPKLFFIQACRGHEMDSGTQGGLIDGEEDINTSTQSSELRAITHLPSNSDFLIAYGTAYGYVSWRSTEKGTWFIEVLCKSLRSYQNAHIMDILTMVNNDLSQKKTTHGLKQIAAPVTMLRGQFFFNPPPDVQVEYLS